ncbi:MAG: DUF4292 domain-containing protein [Deltaproteobacteria bacterium]|nr:DUF4292 domain-containing protein [Deltaproteobacteria bacterium]
MRKLLPLLLLLLPLLGAATCQIRRPYAPPTSEAVLKWLEHRHVTSARVESKMTQREGGNEVKATVRFIVAKGARLRFDAVSPFDSPLSTLVANGTEFTLVDARNNRHYYGPAKACNLARLLRVQLDADAILRLVSGSTPLIGHRKVALYWDGNKGQEVLMLAEGPLRQMIRLQPIGRTKRWDLTRSTIWRANKIVLDIQATDHQLVQGQRVPHRLRISQPQLKRAIDIVYRRIELNPTNLSAEAFVLMEPEGLPSQRLDCAGAAPAQ